jgi:hypothetical protein
MFERFPVGFWRGTFVPLVFAPGEGFQFDWSEEHASVGGVRLKLQGAHVELSDSQVFTVGACLRQTHEVLFDAHKHGFRVLGGVPRRGIYDNMRTRACKVLGTSRHPVELVLMTEGTTLAKLVWRVKVIAELEAGSCPRRRWRVSSATI